MMFGNGGGHDMRVNSAWMLGLAHHETGAVLTTPLDDQTLVRRSAANGPPEMRNTERNFSAYGRRVLAMIQSRHVYVAYGELGRQHLLPTQSAVYATMEELKTPTGMNKQAIKWRLAAAGIDVSGIS